MGPTADNCRVYATEIIRYLFKRLISFPCAYRTTYNMPDVPEVVPNDLRDCVLTRNACRLPCLPCQREVVFAMQKPEGFRLLSIPQQASIRAI